MRHMGSHDASASCLVNAHDHILGTHRLRAHLLAGTDLLDLERCSRPVKTEALTALLQITARDIDPMEAALRALKA